MKREAERMARATELARKEEEKKKRQAEERERQAEEARKKKEREEKARLEREAREKEKKEKDERDKAEAARKEAEDKERKAKEEEVRKETARKEKEARDAADKLQQQKTLEAQRVAAAKATQIKAQKAAAANLAAQTRSAPNTARKASAPNPGSSNKPSIPTQPVPRLPQNQQASGSNHRSASSSSSMPISPMQNQPHGLPTAQGGMLQPLQFNRQVPNHPQQGQSSFQGLNFPPQHQQGGLPARPPSSAYPSAFGLGGPSGPQGYPQPPISPAIHRQQQQQQQQQQSLQQQQQHQQPIGGPSRPSPPSQSSIPGPSSALGMGMGYPQGGPSRLPPVSSGSEPFPGGVPIANQGRRGSHHDLSGGIIGGPSSSSLPRPSSSIGNGSDFRAIQRPMPIGRPDHLDAVDESSSPFSIPSGSSSRRSTSPDTVFGSSALSPDDEIVPRRPSNAQAVWGAPGSTPAPSLGPSPWGGASALGASSFVQPTPSPSSVGGIWSTSVPGSSGVGSLGGVGSPTWGGGLPPAPPIPFSNVGAGLGRPSPFGMPPGGIGGPRSPVQGQQQRFPPFGGQSPGR